MKYALFSDVHGNLDALEAVLAHAGREAVDRFVCLGDVVGYGADPEECVERVRGLHDCTCLKGNHDAATIDPDERTFFHEVALEGIRFTERQLSESSKAFLAGLPYMYAPDDDVLVAVHASPFHPENWEYVLDRSGAERAFRAMGDRTIAFIGHSHAPVVFVDDGHAERFVPGDQLNLEAGRKYVINVGSVGQPRDGNPDASWVLYDGAEASVRIFRVHYDREKAAEKILRAGLPPVLAERLLVGY